MTKVAKTITTPDANAQGAPAAAAATTPAAGNPPADTTSDADNTPDDDTTPAADAPAADEKGYDEDYIKDVLKRNRLPKAWVLPSGPCFDEKHAKHVAGEDFDSLQTIEAE